MAKTILGIDIGYDNMKLALVQGRKVLRTVSVSMPKHLVLQEGHAAGGRPRKLRVY